MRFSVIIPVYNIAQYIGQTLSSVCAAAQRSAVPVEIICVDDGSTDGSGQILEKFKLCATGLKEGVSINIIHQPNAGVSIARNRALDVAMGDYICFVDGDDGVAIDYFEVLSETLRERDIDILCFGHVPCKELPEDRLASSPSDFKVVDFRSFVGVVIVWNACYRRETIGSIRFEPIPNGEDVLFAAEVFMRAKNVVGIPSCLYYYRFRETSAVNVVSLRQLRSRCQTCILLKERIARPEIGRVVRNQLGGDVLAMITRLPAEDRAAGWDSFFNALKVCAWNALVAWVSRCRSRILVHMTLGMEIELRRGVSKIREKAWRGL